MPDPTSTILFDGQGEPIWIAKGAANTADLTKHMTDIRAAAGVTVFQLDADSVQALDGLTGKAAAVREVLKEAIANGYDTAWMITNADADDTTEPATATTNDAKVIRAKLEEARSALLARITGGRLRGLLSHPDVYSDDVFEALQEGGITPELMLAATALHWAIGHGKAGDLRECLVWCNRLHGHLNSVPDAVDDPSDHIRLIWVDSNDEPSVGNVTALAKHIELAALAGDGDVVNVFVFRHGQPVQLDWEVTGTPYNEEQWAENTVTVTLTDGSKVFETWKVDGAV